MSHRQHHVHTPARRHLSALATMAVIIAVTMALIAPAALATTSDDDGASGMESERARIVDMYDWKIGDVTAKAGDDADKVAAVADELAAMAEWRQRAQTTDSSEVLAEADERAHQLWNSAMGDMREIDAARTADDKGDDGGGDDDASDMESERARIVDMYDWKMGNIAAKAGDDADKVAAVADELAAMAEWRQRAQTTDSSEVLAEADERAHQLWNSAMGDMREIDAARTADDKGDDDTPSLDQLRRQVLDVLALKVRLIAEADPQHLMDGYEARFEELRPAIASAETSDDLRALKREIHQVYDSVMADLRAAYAADRRGDDAAARREREAAQERVEAAREAAHEEVREHAARAQEHWNRFADTPAAERRMAHITARLVEHPEVADQVSAAAADLSAAFGQLRFAADSPRGSSAEMRRAVDDFVSALREFRAALWEAKMALFPDEPAIMGGVMLPG